jgi:hypothetical protein
VNIFAEGANDQRRSVTVREKVNMFREGVNTVREKVNMVREGVNDHRRSEHDYKEYA